MRTVLGRVAYEREVAMSRATLSPKVNFVRDVKQATTIAHSSYLEMFGCNKNNNGNHRCTAFVCLLHKGSIALCMP
jgi:hypothetical protein